MRNLGKGIAEQFMMNYNFKVWGVPPREVNTFLLAICLYPV